MRVADVAGFDAAWWLEIACSGISRSVPAPTQGFAESLSAQPGEESTAAADVAADSRAPSSVRPGMGRRFPAPALPSRTEPGCAESRAGGAQVRELREGAAGCQPSPRGIATPYGIVGADVRVVAGEAASARAAAGAVSDPAGENAAAAPRTGTAEYIDLAEVTAMNLSDLPGFLSGMSRNTLDEMFKQYFPGGHPEILEEWDLKAFIQAAIAKRQIQSQAGIPYDFPLAPGIVVSRRA